MNNDSIKRRAMIAMSGGVDSAVAATLLCDEGYAVTGVTMKLYRQGEADPRVDGYRPTDDSADITDARAVAERLHIPHTVAHFEVDFCRSVIDPFVLSYQKGETPNPCVTCNKAIKFGKLFDFAMERGMDVFATGHYARIESDANGRYLIRRAKDEQKDQTYMLWSLSQDVLARVRFPLGDLLKSEVREIAAMHGFVNAHKGDSQDICFLPDGNYAAFLKQYAGIDCPAGRFVDLDGKVLGEHQGIIHYTVGQRKGLGVAFGEPMYVHSKDAESNTVTLCRDEQLFAKRLTAKNANWIAFDRLPASLRVTAKIRYSHRAASVTVTDLGEGRLLVEFDDAQRAITSGQSVVFYDGELLLGGAIIE